MQSKTICPERILRFLLFILIALVTVCPNAIADDFFQDCKEVLDKPEFRSLQQYLRSKPDIEPPDQCFRLNNFQFLMTVPTNNRIVPGLYYYDAKTNVLELSEGNVSVDREFIGPNKKRFVLLSKSYLHHGVWDIGKIILNLIPVKQDGKPYTHYYILSWNEDPDNGLCGRALKKAYSIEDPEIAEEGTDKVHLVFPVTEQDCKTREIKKYKKIFELKDGVFRESIESAQTSTGSAQPSLTIEDAGWMAERGDFEAAVRILIPLAESGNARAQMNLGTMYSAGLGVAQDQAKAVYWTRKAAEAGSPKAQSNLGLAYLYGRGVPRDDGQAVEWLKKAAVQDNAGAQNTLGYLYLEGRGVEKNYATAKKFFAQSIKNGEAGAANNLAKMIEHGLGQSPDVKAALSLYEIAAEGGDPSAQNRIGLAWQNGEFRDRDTAAAKRWFFKSAYQGDQYGQYHLGLLLLTEKPEYLVDALKWISLSARKGYVPAQTDLNRYLKSLNESQKAKLNKLVNQWRPTGHGVFDPVAK